MFERILAIKDGLATMVDGDVIVEKGFVGFRAVPVIIKTVVEVCKVHSSTR